MTLQLVITALNTGPVETLAKFLNFFRVLVSQVSSSRDYGGFQILLILLTSLSNAISEMINTPLSILEGACQEATCFISNTNLNSVNSVPFYISCILSGRILRRLICFEDYSITICWFR